MFDDNASSDGDATRRLPTIDPDQPLARVTAAAWNALHRANDPPRLFRQGTRLVRLEVDDSGKASIRSLTLDRMRYELARAAKWPPTSVPPRSRPGRA